MTHDPNKEALDAASDAKGLAVTSIIVSIVAAALAIFLGLANSVHNKHLRDDLAALQQRYDALTCGLVQHEDLSIELVTDDARRFSCALERGGSEWAKVWVSP